MAQIPSLALVMAQAGWKLASVILFAPVLYVVALDGRWQWLEKIHRVIGARIAWPAKTVLKKVLQFTRGARIKPVPISNNCVFSLRHMYVAVHEFVIC